MRVLGQRAGLYETEFGAALMVLATVALLVGAIGLTAARLNRTEIERRAAMEALRHASDEIRQFNESLERRVQERTAELAEANRDLAQKNQENEMFVYSVSHDLRSPLVNLQGFSKELEAVAADLKAVLASESVPENIRNKAANLLENDVRQSVRFIQTAVSRLGNIIDALLRLSRVGRVEYQRGPVDLNKLVDGVVQSMSAALHDAGVSLRLNELPPCYGDGTALEQLFSNLIGNAVKYRDQGRISEIEVGLVEPELAPQAGETRTYYVKDNGLGIPAAHQDKIFQAFKRAHPSVAPGEGMGLAIVRRTAERHGGHVWVESREGQGSTFFINLPAAMPAQLMKSSSNSPSGESKHGSGINGHLVGGRR
jgi:signal transduction histidine kinase